MRFASLTLERYGRFEDRELAFRPGAPDLHVVYGANEAGKTTSLAAISDLLFGFPTRSPYNFVFDYALLRVGAVLEEDGRTFACRRKKGASGTLVDADDRPLDEGALLALLRGQTRETFGLSFSLNQDGLRAGRRAMVEAKNDLGRALFAAGSGLTGVSDDLARLEAEADAIWAPRAAARRSFTQAQRELEGHAKAVKDQALRPKAWLEAKEAAAAAQSALEEAQRRRDEVLAEVSRAERIRRTAPAARLRADHLASLTALGAVVDLAPSREEAAEAAMVEADAAVRAKTTAENLAREATERMEGLAADPGVLTKAEAIDHLVTASGAVEKAQRDMARLGADTAAADALVKRLREEAGTAAKAPPTRILSAKLRELALTHAQDASALSQIEESESDLAQRRQTLSGKGRSGEAPRDLKTIVMAVDAARALGSDADARCEASQRKADIAGAALEQALARLAPWRGDGAALLALPRLGQHEIDEARTTLSNIVAEITREQLAATRAREEAETLALQREQLASGAAVSVDDIATARSERSDRWRPLREYVLSDTPLPSPDDAVAAFEMTLANADERSDLRFAAADESSRLTDLEQRRVKLLLEADQADGRAKSADLRGTTARAAWGERLAAAGCPDLEPSRFLGWMADRDVAEAAHGAARDAADEAGATRQRRDGVRAALAASLAAEVDAPAGVELAPLLAFAERIRQQSEATEQKRQIDAAALAQIQQDAGGLERRRARLTDGMTARESVWRDLCAEAGIAFDISGATATLDVLEELRAAITAQADLQARVDGILRDAREHDERVIATADALGIAAASDTGQRLDFLRARLEAARSIANVLATLKESVDIRRTEAAAEGARLSAALDSLKPLLEETGSADLAALSGAIERSRAARGLREAVANAEMAIKSAGDGKGLEELIAALEEVDPDSLAARTETLAAELAELNAEVAAAAAAHGDAKRAFSSLEEEGPSAADAASHAEQARAELSVLSEHYILKRAQAVTLRWAIEQYRERHQDPMLLRASELFSSLTIGRYASLRIDNDGSAPRLLGLRDDGRTVVEIGAMSEGTTDQLFLALRLAAVEQSVAAGIRLPFLADDLFVNFDDERSEAGFQMLAELAQSTQVLFFTHHPHLAAIARSVIGASLHSECALA